MLVLKTPPNALLELLRAVPGVLKRRHAWHVLSNLRGLSGEQPRKIHTGKRCFNLHAMASSVATIPSTC